MICATRTTQPLRLWRGCFLVGRGNHSARDSGCDNVHIVVPRIFFQTSGPLGCMAGRMVILLARVLGPRPRNWGCALGVTPILVYDRRLRALDRSRILRNLWSLFLKDYRLLECRSGLSVCHFSHFLRRLLLVVLVLGTEGQWGWMQTGIVWGSEPEDFVWILLPGYFSAP